MARPTPGILEVLQAILVPSKFKGHRGLYPTVPVSN